MKKLRFYFIFSSVLILGLHNGFSQTSQEKAQELSLVFFGDLMGHSDQIKSAYNYQDKTYDYNDCFKYVKPILSDADFAIGNLEVTLGVKPYSGYPQFSSPASYASAIKKAGVDVLMTANNHSCDKGKKGLEKTIQILDSLQISHSGTFIIKEEKELQSPLILEKNGFKLALINYTYGTNGIPPTQPNIVNYLDKEVIAKDVENARLKNPDEIIVFVHWGTQYKNLPSKAQKDWFSYFKSLGVNIVIGSHPHVLQPMILEDNNLVVYSLGNFISHQRTFPRDGGAILKVNLIKEKGQVKIKNANYNLTWVYEPVINGKKSYFILPVKDFEKNSSKYLDTKNHKKMMRFTNHARTLLGKENISIQEE